MNRHPNGFDNWHETHFEIVSYLLETESIEGSLAEQIVEAEGRGGLKELAATMTDEFEKEFAGRVWDGDYYDTLEDWLNQQANKRLQGITKVN